MAESKRLLLVIRRPPYGSSLARASLDVALATAAFDRPLTVLFVGDGVLQLLPEQDCAARGVKNMGRLLASLPLYGIEEVYVDAAAAQRYRLDLNTAPVKSVGLERDAMSRLLQDAEQLLGF